MNSIELLNIFPEPVLQFKAGKENIDPITAFGLRNCKPFYVPFYTTTPKIHIMTPKNYSSARNISKIFTDLKDGKLESIYPRSKYKPFKVLFDMDIDIIDLREFSNLSEIYNKIDDISKESTYNEQILVIASIERSELGGFYYKIKKYSIPKHIQTQIIRLNTIENYMAMTSEKQGDFLWNLSFSIFSKLGGIPWKLNSILKNICAFISINTVTSHKAGVITREGIVALELANSWGETIGRVLTRDADVRIEKHQIIIDPDSINLIMNNALSKIESELGDVEYSKKEEYIIIHVGDRYSNSVYENIKKILIEKGFKKFKILHIQEFSGLRLYDPVLRPSRAWPRSGTHWYLEKGKIAFLYTLGKWKYSLSSEPYTIQTNDISPLQINFVDGNEGSTLLHSDLNNIYHLTKLHYYSADLPRIKMPVTLTLGKRAAQLAASGLTTSDFHISFLY